MSTPSPCEKMSAIATAIILLISAIMLGGAMLKLIASPPDGCCKYSPPLGKFQTAWERFNTDARYYGAWLPDADKTYAQIRKNKIIMAYAADAFEVSFDEIDNELMFQIHKNYGGVVRMENVKNFDAFMKLFEPVAYYLMR